MRYRKKFPALPFSTMLIIDWRRSVHFQKVPNERLPSPSHRIDLKNCRSSRKKNLRRHLFSSKVSKKKWKSTLLAFSLWRKDIHFPWDTRLAYRQDSRGVVLFCFGRRKQASSKTTKQNRASFHLFWNHHHYLRCFLPSFFRMERQSKRVLLSTTTNSNIC
jgi:hypothetical protein